MTSLRYAQSWDMSMNCSVSVAFTVPIHDEVMCQMLRREATAPGTFHFQHQIRKDRSSNAVQYQRAVRYIQQQLAALRRPTMTKPLSTSLDYFAVTT